MTGIQAIGGSFLYYLICLISLGLVTGQLFILLQSIRYDRSKKYMIPAVLNLLLGSCLFVILMDCSMTMIYSQEDALKLRPFQHWLFEVPWIVFAVLETISCVALLLLILGNIRYSNMNLTSDAISETVDLIPEGISISDSEGTVRLSNLKMNELCRELTGSILSDADRFNESIITNGEEQSGQYFVKLPRGEVWLFAKNQISTDDKLYDQLTAVDVTERYRIIEELRANNEHLLDIRRRIKAVSDLSGNMFVAQEEAKARVALHNQLGQVLLMGRYYLEHPERTDANLVYITTHQMNAFLLGEYEELDVKNSDSPEQALAMAKSIGVTVELKGSLPENRTLRGIFARAVIECAANTVKHADGDRMTVSIENDGTHTTITFTNNGKPPVGEISESGGLLSLRRSVEEKGGVMSVQSQPVFILSLTL